MRIDLRDAEAAQRVLVRCRRRGSRASSSLSFSAVTCSKSLRSTESVGDERAGRAAPHDPLRVEHEPVPPGRERGEQLERRVVAHERADEHPLRLADRITDPARDVLRRPRIADLVEPHDPAVALVVEREPRGALGRPPDHREAELLHRREEDLPVGLGATADQHDVRGGVDLAQRPTAVVDGTTRAGRSSCDLVEDEVPEDGGAGHRAMLASRPHAGAYPGATPTSTSTGVVPAPSSR